MMVWDGKCGFCKYWVTRWQYLTEESIDYKTFQEVADQFPDIPLKEFKKASRLIDLDGNIYSGPDSAYKSYDYVAGKSYPYHQWYIKYPWFTSLSDHTYNTIAKNRSFMFKITKAFLGANPLQFKPYWIIYLLVLVISLFFLASLF